MTGLAGFVARAVEALGEWGEGLFTLAETVFPPIPSEAILPLPGVRSLISLPAGAERMNLATFSAFPLAGSGLWNGLLVSLGHRSARGTG